MAHPHKKAIGNMNASSLIGIIDESKMTYVRENLSISLHESQVKLLKQVKSMKSLITSVLGLRNLKRQTKMICLSFIWICI